MSPGPTLAPRRTTALALRVALALMPGLGLSLVLAMAGGIARAGDADATDGQGGLGLGAAPVVTAAGARAAVAAWTAGAAPARVAAAVGDAAFGLPPRPAAVADPAARVDLGRRLFLDRRLSFNGTMSCAMCHVPEEGFASNASRLALGIEGRPLRRNAPTVLNVAWQALLFHDGREPSLEAQAWSPLMHADEMANPSAGHVLMRLGQLPDYAGRFERAFDGRGPTMDTVGEALAAYQRSLVAADTRFDRWRYGAQAGALSPLEGDGFALFAGRARCTACHTVGARDALFSDGRFHVTGAGGDDRAVIDVPLAPGVSTRIGRAALDPFRGPMPSDLGRFEVTLDPADRHAFRTPSLRNVARTAPYMHDGSLPTLEAVIDFYDRGGGDVEGRSGLLAPLGLTPADKQALAAFLRSLDSPHLGALAARARAGATDAASPAASAADGTVR